MRINALALLGASVAVLAAASATAQTTVYDNGPINGTITAWTLADFQHITNSFTLSQTTTITGFTFGGWSNAGQTITSVEYGFGSSTDNAITGISALTYGDVVPDTGFGGSYDVRNYTGSVAPITLGAGTWYFTLGAAATSDGSYAYWDINNGPSDAYANGSSLAGVYGPTSSTAFSLTSGGAVPEPASWALMVGGFGLVGGAMRARRRTVAFA